MSDLLETSYKKLGICKEVYEFGAKIENELKDKFDKKYEEFEEMYLDNIRDMMLNYCSFMDEVNEWRSRFFRW